MARKEIHWQNNTFPIAYDICNPAAGHDMIVLHGWGSNKEIMQGAFAKRLPQFRHIYIDLPGFGKSPNPTVLTTEAYAAIVDTFLDTLGARKEVVVGHSFGGKVATLLQPDLLVLLSSAGIPTEKAWDVKLKIRLFKLFRHLGLGSLRRYFASDDAKAMPQNMYETFKNVVDEDFSDIFAAYPGPALLFWGKEDTATPLSSGETIAGLIEKSRFYPLEGDHFFFTTHAGTIADTITKYHTNETDTNQTSTRESDATL